ncbi:MAG: hydroxyacid dehydrogenase [Candidatus Sungbacteria bacterium]|uniref:Hydroxyacid dehydrogenase n=1 Tax=Candidatus Sungiibacteriota bacterium TaxID=2750080 RepID=A0A931YDQ8_9BACT|nr:hydroxyacid dehydrogenase [Candidatus Sungbacteria bacterium]MBI2466008.1 hydroxyacid dehydrogenase [Candidatus Sungbacteria bacterium]
MKAVFFEVTDKEKEYISANLPETENVFVAEKINEENAATIREAKIISVFVGHDVTGAVMDALPNLSLIAARSTGFDHIDLEHARAKNIAVANVPAYGSRTVAEFTFGLMLTLSRKIFSARRQMLESEDFSMEKLEGFDLKDKTLGVVGTGRIGRNVIKIARAFEMNVLAADIKPDENFAAEAGFQYMPLEELLKNSDIISLHAPYLPETKHLINSDNIQLMKKGAYLINTARGELVETDALLKALTTGQLAGAGLDVLESERQLKEEAELLTYQPGQIKDFKTLSEDHILINMPQVVVTPHIAFCTAQAREEIIKTTVENIKSFLAATPQNLV